MKNAVLRYVMHEIRVWECLHKRFRAAGGGKYNREALILPLSTAWLRGRILEELCR